MTTHPPSIDREPAPLRVLVAYSYSMHFRLGVFRALLASPDAEVAVAAGTTPPVDVTTTSSNTVVAPIEPADLPEMQWHRTRTLGPLRWHPSLFAESISRRYDAVVWDPSLPCMTMWLSSLVLRLRRRTLVYWGLGWTTRHGRVKERLKVRAFRLAHGFLTYGQRSAELAVAAGYPKDRVRAVGNSLPDTHDARVVAAGGIPAADPLVLGVALRLMPRKRVDLLVRAVAALNERGMPTRAIVVGGGSSRPELEALAAELGADVHFTGALYEPGEVADYYAQIHMSVIPGHAGLTVTGSLMHGRPVVLHDNPAHHAAEWEAVRPGISGALFAEDDLDSCVATILAVKARLDAGAEHRAEIARACRADYLEHGEPTAHARRITTAVRDFAARRSHPRAFSPSSALTLGPWL